MRHLLLASLSLLLTTAAYTEDAAPSAEARIKALEDRLAKIENAPAKTSLSAFNPAMGAAVDFAYSHSNGPSNFAFRAAELNVEAPIDPFLKGWIIITGSQNAVAVEEATLQTTSLPYNLTVTGGRLFASFGRLAHFHDHELPVIERPRSLDTYIGGETQADGVEVSYLVPAPFFLTATGGVFNKLGATNARADNAVARPMNNFTYLGRLATYADLGDDHSVELGLSEAWTPKRFVVETAVPGGQTRKNTWRSLAGLDFTYRWQPTAGGAGKGLVWSTEVMQNNERRFNTTSNLPTDRVRAYAGFSYVELKLGTKWRPGVMVDLTEDLDSARTVTRTYTSYLTYHLTEFQRLRLSFALTSDNRTTGRGSSTVGLQWTGVLGHHVHGFRDR